MRGSYLCLLLCWLLYSPLASQNISMRSDGNEEYISRLLGSTPLGGNPGAFTFETWFNSETPVGNVSCQFGVLFPLPIIQLRGDLTRINVGQCGETYRIEANLPGGFYSETFGIATSDEWRHLAITFSDGFLRVYLDCSEEVVIPLSPTQQPNLNELRIGFREGFFSTIAWRGYIDEVRAWETALSSAQLCNQQHCPLAGDENGLVFYWTFDEGNPGLPNPTTIEDQSVNNFPGKPIDYTLDGNNSNFVDEASPIVFPAYHELDFQLFDYARDEMITDICSGDPAHFCLFTNGTTFEAGPNTEIRWEQATGLAGTWVALPNNVFNGSCFPVGPNVLNGSCFNNPEGFVDNYYRAVVTVTDPTIGESCTYRSNERMLRICCELNPATVTLNIDEVCVDTEAPAPLEVTGVLLSPDAHIDGINPDNVVRWERINPNGTAVLISESNVNDFTDVFSPTDLTAPGEYCFRATFFNINCPEKVGVAQACITVEPQPLCGSIEGFPYGNPQNLTLLDESPQQITYGICPGQDAVLAESIDDPFSFCNPVWQFSFDQEDWTTIGSSNVLQNTNVLPTTAWGDNVNIFYRVVCEPLLSPSVCSVCKSNLIEIKLLSAPKIPVIIGKAEKLCLDDFPILLTATPAAPPDGNLVYTWFHDGLEVGTGNTYAAQENGCYEVVANNPCGEEKSDPFCIEACGVAPLLLVRPDEECNAILANACLSQATCAGMQNLSFVWRLNGQIIDDGLVPECYLIFSLPAVDVLLTVTITDNNTGCSGTAIKLINGCIPDN